MRQQWEQPLEAGKGKVTDSPIEPPGKQSPAEALPFSSEIHARILHHDDDDDEMVR